MKFVYFKTFKTQLSKVSLRTEKQSLLIKKRKGRKKKVFIA